MIDENLEQFYPKIQKSVSGVFFISLKKETVDAVGWKEGDRLKVLAKKIDDMD